VDEVRYESVGACLRAPRFVVAYRPGLDWVYTVRRVIQSLSRVWGGAGAVMLPAPRVASCDLGLLGLIRSYDPDVVAGHIPLVEDEVHFDGTAPRPGSGDSGVRDPSARRHLFTQTIEVGPWDDVARLADAWCSPFKGVHQDARSFAGHEVVPLARQADSYQYLTVIPPMPGQPPLVTLDLSGVDPVVALMIESRIGALGAHDQAALQPVGLPVEDADVGPLIRMAITGQTRFTGWDPGPRYLAAVGAAATGEPSALSGEQFLQCTPFARTRRWLTLVRTFAATPPPVVCVIGGTAADHALAVSCDRLFHRAGWIPLSILQDDKLASSARLGIYELGHIPGSPPRPVLITSISESPETLQAVVSELRSSYGLSIPGDTRGDFLVIGPDELASEPARYLLADPGQFAVARTVPVRRDGDGCSFLTPVDLPLPEAAGHLPAGMHWQVDVTVPGHRVPARPAIPGNVLTQIPPGGIPDTIVRAGRYGVSFSSVNMGFVPAGGPAEGRLAHPVLRFPSAQRIFAELAASRGNAIERSDAGRRAANAAELWGSFEAIAADLTGPARPLLDAFLPPQRKKDGDFGSGYAIRSQGYLHFNHAEHALGLGLDDTRKVLDRLVGLDVLRRGLLLTCERCRWQAFYAIDQLGKTFTCAACSYASNLVAGTWYKKDPEPAWNYSLDQVVRMLLSQHGDLPLLAADHLRRGTRDFLWAPELCIHGEDDSIEIDICAIIDGRVIVGEAKCNGRLDSKDRSAQEAASRLVRAAQILTADGIALATSAPSWAPGVIAAIEAAVSVEWQHGPRPEIIKLVSLGH
jgi:hypothetical protein